MPRADRTIVRPAPDFDADAVGVFDGLLAPATVSPIGEQPLQGGGLRHACFTTSLVSPRTCTLAAVTVTVSSRSSVSTSMRRLRPLTFLLASKSLSRPCGEGRADEASTAAAIGPALRPCASATAGAVGLAPARRHRPGSSARTPCRLPATVQNSMAMGAERSPYAGRSSRRRPCVSARSEPVFQALSQGRSRRSATSAHSASIRAVLYCGSASRRWAAVSL